MCYRRLKLVALVPLIIELVLGMSMPGFTQPRNNPTGFMNKENLLKNPGFEEGTGNRPAWWLWMPNPDVRPGDFEVSWTEESHSGRKAVKIVATRGGVGGYWGSPMIPIEAGHHHAEAYVKGTRGARILLLILGRAEDGKTITMNERAYLMIPSDSSPLATFVPEKALAYPMPEKWTKMEKDFTVTRDTHYLSIRCGSYFGEGTIWIDDLSLISTAR